MHIKGYSPSFCFIAPTDYLHYVTGATNTHLVLAHLVDKDPVYAEFYKNRSEQGDLVICDNGAYELGHSYDPNKLIELGRKCGAEVLVLPDYPFEQASKTIAAAVEYIPLFKQAGFKTFFVPQSQRGDLEDWIAGYTWAARHPDIDCIGYSILGIPNALPEIEPSYARVVMAQILNTRKIYAYDKHSHYLGLNAGPGLEIPSLLRMGVLDTVDSSGPVWAAILGHQYSDDYDSLQAGRKIKMPVQFDLKLTKDLDTMKRIQNNIAKTLALFNDDDKQSIWYAQE